RAAHRRSRRRGRSPTQAPRAPPRRHRMSFNPTAHTLGDEWAPVRRAALPIAAVGIAAVDSFISTDTETIKQLVVPLQVTAPGPLLVEIYDADNDTVDDTTTMTDIFQPNEDVANNPGVAGDQWKNESAVTATGSLYQSIDDDPTTDETDFLETGDLA